jgi:uncharacterized membrane protein YcaP (DUF421 family)
MSVDWQALFAFSIPPLELVIRGSAIYWFLLVLFRVVLRRDVGAIAVADVLLLVLVADAAQNAMAGEYRSITDGLVLVSTIVGWNVLVDWLAYRFAAIRRLLEAPALLLVREGRILHRNLRREFLTVEDLLGKLREHGVDDIGQVRAAYMESDGEVSVIERRGAEAPRRRARRAAGG